MWGEGGGGKKKNLGGGSGGGDRWGVRLVGGGLGWM